MVLTSTVADLLPILVVEDDARTLDDVARELSDRFRVWPAGGRREGLALWHEHPELLLALVDLRIPEDMGLPSSVETGFRLIGELARRPGSVIVVRSAYNERGYRQTAARLGARDYLLKDDPFEEFYKRLNAARASLVPHADPAGGEAADGPAPLTEAMRRHLREHDSFFRRVDWVDRYAGEVVAVHGGVVWGHGADHEAAAASAAAALLRAAAEERPGLPVPQELTFLVVPDWKTPEPSLPSY
jgi:CheY-like chemotaxis protein